MLPREGTETKTDPSYISVAHVNNPCYLERGRKLTDEKRKRFREIVNNPCYLERGRKHIFCQR